MAALTKKRVFVALNVVLVAAAAVAAGGFFYFRHVADAEHTATAVKPVVAWCYAAAGLAAFVCGAPAARPASLLFALAFAVYGVGDIFMCWGDKYLTLGMATFVVGHMLISGAMYWSGAVCKPPVAGSAAGRRRTVGTWLACVVLVAAASGVSWFYYTRSQKPLVALCGVIYSLGFVAVLTAATKRLGKPQQLVAALLGTALYFVSDCCISIRSVIAPNEWMRVFIMGTYYAALLCYYLALLPAMTATFRQPGRSQRKSNAQSKSTDKKKRN